MIIRDFKDGDIKTDGVQFAKDERAVAQGVYHRLRMFLGEYFIDVRAGTPWFQSILGKVPQDIAEVNIKNQILSSPGVVGLDRFEFSTDRDQRQLSVSATIRTVFDQPAEITLNESLF